MGRPKRVYPSTLHLYDKLHTRKVKMYSGVELTGLHCVKETDQMYISLDSWCSCCGPFKKFKYGFDLQFDIPIAGQDVKEFLQKHAWGDWVAREIKDKDQNMIETISFLDRIFPDKKKVYFYELQHLVSGFTWGTFGEIKDGVRLLSDKRDKNLRYYNYKYQDQLIPKEITDKRYPAVRIEDEKKRSEQYSLYYEEACNWIMANANITDLLYELGTNVIVCPYVFSKCVVEGSTYENAGDIYFIVTDDAVYFETARHY